MSIRPVRSEQAYGEALERIEMLWGAKPGTPEGDELDVLLALVGMYEKENHPVPPPSPIEAIKFTMDQRGMKQVDLIPYIGSQSKVSEILNGKRTLSLSMIRMLHSSLGIPADVLIQDGKSFPLKGETVPWDSFPVSEIVKNGWVAGLDPKTQAEEIMRNLANQAGADDYFLYQHRACLRQGTRRNEKDNPFSISAWILRVLSQATKTESLKFESNNLDKNLVSKVAHLSILENGPLIAKEYLSKKGIKMIVVPHLKKTYLDGAAMISKNKEPIIALTLRYDRLDNFWFTLTHELAHLVLGHVSETSQQCIIDDLDLSASLDDIEIEADEFAKEALIPEYMWKNHNVRTTFKYKDVIALSRKAEIHHSIVAGRIRHENKNYRILSNCIGQGEVRRLFN